MAAPGECLERNLQHDVLRRRRALVKRAGLVAAFAFLLQGVYLYEASAHYTFQRPLVDAGDYHSLAGGLLETGSLTERYFYQPVFYPLWLALVYLLSDGSIWVAKLAQAAVAALTCGLSALLAGELFGRRGALIAGGICAVYGPLIYFNAELLATGWAAFAAIALVGSLCWAVRAPRSRIVWLLVGLLSGFSVAVRPTFLPFAVFAATLAPFYAWRVCPAFGVRGFLLRAALVVVAAASVLVPLAWTSYAVTSRLTVLPSGGGINLYIGNHPDAARLVNTRPGYYWYKLMHEAEYSGARNNWEMGSHFSRLTKQQILADPAGWTVRLGEKALQICSSRELPRNLDPYLWRADSYLLSASLWRVGHFGFPFGLLFPLAAVGLVFRWRAIPWPVKLFLLLYPAAIVLVFISARYRVPLVPVLAVVAAGGVTFILDAVRRCAPRALGYCTIVAAAAVALSTIPGRFPQERVDYASELQRFVAGDQAQRGEWALALASYTEAIELNPTNTEAHVGKGALLLNLGRPEAAQEHFEAALRLDPEREDALTWLGDLALRDGRYDAARQYYESAVELNPRFPEALQRLATLHLQGGRPAEAVVALERLVALRPQDVEARSILALLLATVPDRTLRDPHRALHVARYAVRLSRGQNGRALQALAAAHAGQGDFVTAMARARQALDVARSADESDLVEHISRELQRYRAAAAGRPGAAP